jgi:cytochrome c2
MNVNRKESAMKRLLPLCLAITVAGTPALAVAADAANGKTLVQDNCTSCHDTGVYTREDRKVTTLGGLEKQVRRCELSLGLKWFDDDVADVVAYLNDNFYKFR